LALSLKKHDIESTVYEKREQGAIDQGSVGLAPNALRVLDYIGVYDRVKKLGYNYEQLNLVDCQGTILAGFYNGSEKAYGFKALRIRRKELRRELLAEVANQGIKVYFSKRCQSVEEMEDTATATFEDGERVAADFVIGADGASSAVRSFLDPKAALKYDGLVGISTRVSLVSLEGVASDMKLPVLMLGSNGMFSFMPEVPDGSELYFFTSFALEDRSREEWKELSNDKERLRQMMIDKGDLGWPEVIRKACEVTNKDSISIWP
jgi:2-polyprenyl-6-methoxyphenol hydroxylase-like FAD-dependent oxidoreductase